ncbi:helix-turn-helix domain-containing protein [Actinomadura alba]|uniref:Helix-turn-helix domain-containing protein n=1 Tax=Actinomadura alba TaxID=406431 RepID=A0ABR7LWM9_9ACTN|nr:helix-turn-helix transcriptional regulator [Actinomadura alba]MBC6469155.1 helix-turn-helix domain-containing protein [Actinomadura alba]
MPEEPPSSARLRRIGRTLRELREAKRMTLKAAGHRVERSSGSLSLIENGLQPLRLRDLKHILDVYGAPDGTLRVGLMELARQARQTGWWTDFKDVLSPSGLDYASLEYDATLLDAIETQFIPGLLQTEAYTRAVMESSLVERQIGKADQLVAFRMARQQILRRPDPPQLRTILDEATLRRVRGGREVMRAQLHQLLNESQRDHITLQVLPFSCMADPGINGASTMLEIGRPSILSAVLVDHLTGRLTLEDEADLVRYRETFERACAVALSETDSRTLIQRIISEL